MSTNSLRHLSPRLVLLQFADCVDIAGTVPGRFRRTGSQAVMAFWLAFLAMIVPSGSAALDAGAAEYREYETGPLTQRDFAATAPNDNQQLLAFTTNDLRFEYGYRYNGVPGRYVATLNEIKVRAVVIPNKSWVRKDLDVRLLDHEQGHFDLTYIAAMRQRIYFAKMLRGRDRDRLAAVGKDQAEAIELLRQKIEEHMKSVFDATSKEQIEYDRQTQHGLNPQKQAEQRQSHSDAIRGLSEEWKPFEKK